MIILALPKLFDDVVERFDDESTGLVAEQVFGWRERARHPTSGADGCWRRIVWVPGDDSNGRIGEVLAARSPGRNPRSLATLEEQATVYLEAADLSTPETSENERAQYQAARELFDAWFRAAHLAAYGTLKILDVSWVRTAIERSHGAAIRVLLTIQAMVPDRALATIGVGARAEWTTELGDNTEASDSDP